MMEEVWKPIKGYEDIYEVSSYGRVRSLGSEWDVVRKDGVIIHVIRKGKIRYLSLERTGYMRICLYKDNKRDYQFVHRLVANAFIPNPENLPFINHKDENKQNNRVENLEWCTRSYNALYGTAKQRSYDNGGGRRKRPVNQYSKDGEFIRTYPSATEAAEAVGAKQHYITCCCLGRSHTSMGYVWRYVE